MILEKTRNTIDGSKNLAWQVISFVVNYVLSFTIRRARDLYKEI
jgi:hypothetical protein